MDVPIGAPMRALVLAILIGATAGVSAAFVQQPPIDESEIQESEKRIPPGHYCKAMDVPIGKNEPRAHHCDCKYSCTVNPDGTVSEHESQDCQAYCHKNGRRCTCHTEEPCWGTPQHGNVLMDMDGRVVAIVKP